jgi:hypothetical protein
MASIATGACCAAPGLAKQQEPALLMDVSSLNEPELHLDLSGQHKPVLFLEVSTLLGPELHLDMIGQQERDVYTTGSCAALAWMCLCLHYSCECDAPRLAEA